MSKPGTANKAESGHSMADNQRRSAVLGDTEGSCDEVDNSERSGSRKLWEPEQGVPLLF